MWIYSYSQVADFVCPFRWAARYQMGLVPTDEMEALTVGKAVHQGLYQALLHNYDSQRGIAAVRDQVPNEQLPLVSDLIERSCEHLATLGWETVQLAGRPLLECPLLYHINNELGYIGVVDWVARDQEGRVWLVDFKTRARFEDDEDDEFNLQLAAYQHLLALTGIETTGSLQLQIKRQTPAVPSRNKDGSMSRAKIATDWRTYHRTLLAAGLEPEEYAEMPAKLAEIEWFRHTRTYRSPETVRRVWEQVLLPALYAWHAQRPDYRVMNTWNCRLCAYQALCVAAMRDTVVDPSLYRPRDEQDRPSAAPYLIGAGYQDSQGETNGTSLQDQ